MHINVDEDRFMWIFAGVFWKEGTKLGGSQNDNFQCFGYKYDMP